MPNLLCMCWVIRKFNALILSHSWFDLRSLMSLLASLVSIARSLFSLFSCPPLRFGLCVLGMCMASVAGLWCRFRYSSNVIGRGPAVLSSKQCSMGSFVLDILLAADGCFGYLVRTIVDYPRKLFLFLLLRVTCQCWTNLSLLSTCPGFWSI